MAFGSAHRRGRIVAEINVTPLTDVFLVLLIIFMITTSAMVKPAADVNLPETSDTPRDATENVMVTMTPTKQIYVGDRAVDGDNAAVVSALKDALAHAKQKVVILAGDRQVVLGEVVRVLSLAKEAGASGFALASE
jgi:biopolymer transport protein ExbD